MGEFVDGVWVSQRTPKRTTPVPGLLLDRDGVLVEEVDFLCRVEDVRLAPGAIELLVWAKRQAVAVAIVTNQSGIARGLFGWEEYRVVESEIDRQLAAYGLMLDLVVACPFHESFTLGYDESFAVWRKPGPGMIHCAENRLNLDSKTSMLIGDKAIDIEAARNGGLPRALLVLTGYGPSQLEPSLALAREGFAVNAIVGLGEALPHLGGLARSL